ncbi:MAG: YggS family pyridoxal phosphate-dependent enzyme [candidate division WOR-3 bacterium]|nr:YggS family pyridoxal phosphate-dependent enzyme [candidate division WOR-3 bacterium]MCX7836879.1 YggS family pyridoxal phosphate-dependent enzyme [candidate division WOR-3 bacterium]MDW8114424.1 YggS family pyridoxal phosphate-dependent enzyme [candidate division WOR-3 bacterium]
MIDIKKNIENLLKKIEEVCNKIGRKKEEIEILAVTKGVDTERIKAAISYGLNKIGENRIQEAIKKIPLINSEFKNIEWHFIGHLQTNKVKKAVKYFSYIQSLDRIELAEELEKVCERENKIMSVFIEVNTSFEKTKFGISPEDLERLIEYVLRKPHLKLVGLMTLGPISAIENKENSRKSFRLLYELREKMKEKFNISLPYLSMGMSSDFEVAIEEGANIIRIGTLIFGPRNQ